MAVTNQGFDYTVEATAVNTSITSYTWTIDGVIDTSITGSSYTFTGIEFNSYNICVSMPCDTLIIESCESIFVDSLDNTPIDSNLFSCLQGLSQSQYPNEGFLSVYADFDGFYYDPANISWSIDGVTNPQLFGSHAFITPMTAGTYYVCATYTSDSCTTTYCDSVVVTDYIDPMDSLNNDACLTGIFTDGQDGYLSAFAEFDGLGNVDYTNLTWTIDGVTTPANPGGYLFAQLAAGTYTVCATYDTDSCIATFCDSVVVTDPIDPMDSLNNDGCLIGITTYAQSGYLSAYPDFDGFVFDYSDLTWTIDGVTTPAGQGGSLYTQLAAGTYYVCATFDTDSCTATFCDSVVVTDPIDPTDSLDDAGCLINVTATNFGAQYFFLAEFDNPIGIASDLSWTIDGATASGVTGSYFSFTFADGDYTICATYDTDSCTNTICIDITVDNTTNGNDSLIYIDSIGFGDWIINNWDSVYIDSTLWDEINDWDTDDWTDSLIDIIFGDSLNINDIDSNDIYVILDGLTQDDIDSLFDLGIVGFDQDDLDEYWDDFLDANDDIVDQDYSFNDLLDLFNDFMSAKAADQLSINEIHVTDLNVFFNPNTGILTINADNIGLINVYNIQGQRVLSRNDNNPQLNLSSINTGLYILSIEIDGKLYSHKIVK